MEGGKSSKKTKTPILQQLVLPEPWFPGMDLIFPLTFNWWCQLTSICTSLMTSWSDYFLTFSEVQIRPPGPSNSPLTRQAVA